MPTDLTGTPTSLGIGTYNVDVDAPSGLGFNAAMAQIDALIAERPATPAGIAAGEAMVWNGTAFVRSSQAGLVTGLAGATAAARFVGGTASGAPTTGTFSTGDFVIDQSGSVWVCTAGGTPGTWKQAGGGTTPPGTELDYKQITANVTIPHNTSEASLTTVITGNPVTYDGATRVKIEFYSAGLGGNTFNITLVLLKDGAHLGHIADGIATSETPGGGVYAFFDTPSAGSHTYSIGGYNNGGTYDNWVVAGPGNGSGVALPAYLRITRA